jgi:Cu-Zn family superoxide dismutase
MKNLLINATLLTAGLGMCAAGLAAQASSASGAGAGLTATAVMVDAEGRGIGEARLQQVLGGVLLRLDLKNATPGVHALHIHDVGRCDGPSFESAGPHYSPEAHKHGFLNTRGPHAGDLPNIFVPASTELSVEFLVRDVTLSPGPHSLLDANGSALVIHAGKDDYKSDPAGESGGRLGCGPIVRSGT